MKQNLNNILLDKLDIPVGVNILYFNGKNELLLGLRHKKGYPGDGSWGLIGGKLKNNETIEETAVRELKEEVNIDCRVDDLEIINMGSTITATHFIQIGIMCKRHDLVPRNMEPEKCQKLEFFPLDKLPINLFFGTKVNIDLYLSSKFYDKKYNYIDQDK